MVRASSYHLIPIEQCSIIRLILILLLLGEEVLDSLSFGGDTIGDACFGLGMVFLGFMVAAVVALDQNRKRFMKLGHVGGVYAKNQVK